MIIPKVKKYKANRPQDWKHEVPEILNSLFITHNS